jgi:hypothetical protein
MIDHAPPTLPSAAAGVHASVRRPLELQEARRQRDTLRSLLRTEQAAMADFLVALAGFDARRGWEALGHASLFAFLVADLGLTPAPTFWRQEAARLLQRFPDLEGPLRHGKLCLTTMAELAKVLTAENREALLPRFLGISSREAKEIVAELQPREVPATRAVVTRLLGAAQASCTGALASSCSTPAESAPSVVAGLSGRQIASPSTAPIGVPPSQLWAPKVDFGGDADAHVPRDAVEPLTADLRRLHVTVSRQFLKDLDAARDGLAHAVPGATTEQVLRAALDLLLEKQARARGLVRRPRAIAAEGPVPTTHASAAPRSAGPPVAPAAEPTSDGPPLHRRVGPREIIPAAVRRAVWVRDGGRCSWPLDGGGTCGSTHRLELDHVVPWARGGEDTVANLRLTCAAHNRTAARQAFGGRTMKRYAGAGGKTWA